MGTFELTIDGTVAAQAGDARGLQRGAGEGDKVRRERLALQLVAGCRRAERDAATGDPGNPRAAGKRY